MPNLLIDLEVDRIDLVDEGANSAAFIELYKRKEQSEAMDIQEILTKMKPEHVEVIQAELAKSKADLEKANADLTAANDSLASTSEELNTLKAKCAEEEEEAKKKAATFDETETIKAMPEEARAIVEKLKAQKEAAEEELRKAKESEKQSEAIAKASSLKALPVDSVKLVEVLKASTPDMVDMLTAINAAIEGTVLSEVGKGNTSDSGGDAWSKIEAKADEIAKRDKITKQKAVGTAIKENPDLYKEYLNGGAN